MTDKKNADVAGRRQESPDLQRDGEIASPSRRSFLLAAGAAATAAVGATYAWRRSRRSALQSGIAAEYEGPSTQLVDVAKHAPFDVCIVGSGPAGVTLGTKLARAGLQTLIVEAGVNPTAMGADARFAMLNQCNWSGDLPYALTATRAFMPGGTTSLWTGNTPRLLPIDFEVNAYTPPGAAWPFKYQEIEPYYELAEQTLQTTGEADARHVAPRRKPLRYRKHDGNLGLKTLLGSIDIVGFDTLYSSTRQGGPIRVARDLLPEFARERKAVFVSGVTARRFLGGEKGSIETCMLEDFTGMSVPVSARAFVLAAGGAESARRLLLSRSDAFEHGIGNQYDVVGRHFADHPVLSFSGTVARPRELGRLPQTVRSYQYYEAFKRKGLGGASLTVSLRDIDDDKANVELRISSGLELYPSRDNRLTLDASTQDPFGDPILHLGFSMHERDYATFNAARQMIREIYGRAGARNVEELPTHWAHHHLSSVPAGADPRTSVVDGNLCVHGLNNLFVVTSGNFVTSGPANPTLLIVALAHRLAAHLRGTLQSTSVTCAS